jgi:hypothetical protein
LTKKTTKASAIRAHGKPGKPALKLAANKTSSPFARIETRSTRSRQPMIIIVDDADRRTKGDLMVAAER